MLDENNVSIAEGQTVGVSRRTIAKGAAWTVPAIVMAGAAPAVATSPSLRLVLSCACKLPGNSCGSSAVFQSYYFFFSATNPGGKLRVTSITFTRPKKLGTTQDTPFSLTFNSTIEVGTTIGAQTIPIEVPASSTNSANQDFYTTMTVKYAHYEDDGTTLMNEEHVLVYCIVVSDTPPNCGCVAGPPPIVTKPATDCDNTCAKDGACAGTPNATYC